MSCINKIFEILLHEACLLFSLIKKKNCQLSAAQYTKSCVFNNNCFQQSFTIKLCAQKNIITLDQHFIFILWGHTINKNFYMTRWKFMLWAKILCTLIICNKRKWMLFAKVVWWHIVVENKINNVFLNLISYIIISYK